jgi:fatty-acyl-CoA synthase
MAGAPCPDPLMRRVMSEMHCARDHHRLRHDRDQPGVLPERHARPSLERRVSTVGRIQPHVEVKIVDGEGRTVPVGETGELLTRGYS